MRLALAFVLITTAASAQFQIEDTHTTADLRGIVTAGEGVAWASGTNGTVLRTEDAGFVWQLCAIPPGAEHLDFRGIQAFDHNTAIVMSSGKGDLSRLYKTTDGCETWKLLFSNPDKDGFWDAILLDHANGWVLGDPVDGHYVLLATSDGGKSWTQLKTDGLKPHTPESGAFAASNSSLLDGSVPSFATGGPGGSFFYFGDSTCTMNTSLSACIKGGAVRFTQSRVNIAGNTASQGTFSLAKNGLKIIAVGGDYVKPSEGNGSAACFDPVLNGWLAATTPPHGFRSAVAYDPTHKTWITVGPNGTDISTDDGRNWHALEPGASEAPDTAQHWNALSLPYVVGPHGRIGRLRPDALK